MDEARFPELRPLLDYLAGETNESTTSAWLARVRQWQARSPATAAAWPVQNDRHAQRFQAWYAEWMTELSRLEGELSRRSETKLRPWPGSSAVAL